MVAAEAGAAVLAQSSQRPRCLPVLPAVLLGVPSVCLGWLETQGGRRPAAPARQAAPPSCPWVLQGRGCARSALPVARRVPGTRPRDGHWGAQTGLAQTGLKGCRQLLGRGLLSTGTWRPFSPDRGPQTAQKLPKEQLPLPGNGGTLGLQRGSDSNSRPSQSSRRVARYVLATPNPLPSSLRTSSSSSIKAKAIFPHRN